MGESEQENKDKPKDSQWKLLSTNYSLYEIKDSSDTATNYTGNTLQKVLHSNENQTSTPFKWEPDQYSIQMRTHI